MAKEASSLVAARAALKRAEEDLGDPERLVHLRDAVRLLVVVMSGESPKIEKDISRKLALSCRNKALGEAKVIAANLDAYETATLEHWRDVLEAFVDAGLDDDPDFSACRAQLSAKRDAPGLGKFTPSELAGLAKELQAALDCLSDHRMRLSNIKWGTLK